jgi:V/A-type H+/Na+-transporting ATPase subunit B
VRLGRIAALDEDSLKVEMLDETAGLALSGTRVRFLGEPLRFHVGPGLLGRLFNGIGQPLDGGPPLAASRTFRVDGLPIKPSARQAPDEYLETDFTAIDLMNSLVRGQKLPLFSAAGCRTTGLRSTSPAKRADPAHLAWPATRGGACGRRPA